MNNSDETGKGKEMKILFLGNNWLGWQILKWLKETGRNVVGLVIHPEEKQKYTDKILNAAGLPPECIFLASSLKKAKTLEKIKTLAPDAGLSVMFDYILDKTFLDLFPGGIFNLHPGYLPYNKGAFANVWAIVDQMPAGVTFHVIDEGVDTGAIITQKKVKIEPIDTGETLYRKLEKSGIALFKEAWPSVESRKFSLHPQNPNSGTIHKKSDVEQIDCIDPDKTYKARDLINLLRARTFPSYKGAYFEENGKKIYLELKLYYGDAS